MHILWGLYKRTILNNVCIFDFTSNNFWVIQVAVLDASLGGGVHPNTTAIVADTLNEQFVNPISLLSLPVLTLVVYSRRKSSNYQVKLIRQILKRWELVLVQSLSV